MAIITLTLDAPLAEAADLILAIPFDTPEQRVTGVSVSGTASVSELRARNSGQRALCLTVKEGALPVVSLDIAEAPGRYPDWLFTPTGGAHETPSTVLAELVAGIAPVSLPAAERVARIVGHVEARFTYGVRAVGLGDDADAMPALACGTHLGTCIDMHAYLVAALRAGGVAAAYVSGVFFAEGDAESVPGHCWCAVQAEGVPHHWDVAHFLKYGLGPVRPVLNPKPGCRFALSAGRDLVFEGADGPVTFGRLSGFGVLSGPARGAKCATRAMMAGHEGRAAAF